ncbi:MAG: VWA domain-containing protein [Desulfomonilaceae bacterium]|nr:VWA domain-containing protein [Desulfomonilaceae bacterium]
MKKANSGNRVSANSAEGVVLIVLLVLWFLLGPAAADDSNPRVKCRVETDRSVLAVGSPRTIVVKVTLDAEKPPKTARRPPVNLAIALDRSGSMTGEKLAKAKEAAIEALGRLGSSDVFSLVAYDHTVTTVVPAQRVGDAYGIRAKIRDIHGGGNTALFGGVSQSASEVRKHLDGEFVNRIILLSDGLANVGPSSPEELGRLGAALIKEGISVTTVGVGLDYNEDLMTRLSRNSDGNSYFVESSRDLARIFNAELGDVLSVVAQKVHIIVEFPEDVRPVSIIGRDGRIRDRKVELSMNQLYGGQEKYALIEIEVPSGKVADRRDIAAAVVTYTDAVSQRRSKTGGSATIRFSKDRSDVEKSVNVDVQKAYELTLSAIAQEDAVALADKGRDKEAGEALRRSAERLKEVGRRYRDEKLLIRAKETAEQATQVSSQGMTGKARKSLKTDSHQTRQQQYSR